MYWHNTFVRLEESYSVIIITFILVFNHIILSSTETISMVEILDNTPTVNQSFDPASKLSSTQNEIANFLHVDDEELSKQLINVQVTIDGSGDTTEPISETTTPFKEPTTNESTSISSPTPTQTISFFTTRPPDDIKDLSGFSRFIITMSCTNTNSTIRDIVNKFNETFKLQYVVAYDPVELPCVRSLGYNVTFNFTTDSNVTVLTELYKTFANIITGMGFELYSVDKCDDGRTVLVTNVASCYLIELCELCGTNPPRGICLPGMNVSKCQCFTTEDDSSMSYVGEFCKPEKKQISTLPSWTPIVVAVLAGVASLFCAITCFLLVTTLWRRRHPNRNQIQNQPIQRTWHLPRVKLPTKVTAENLQNSEYDRSVTTDNRFDGEFEQNMSANLRATITRPNRNAVLETDTISTVSSYDPIDELDDIIDDEDSTATFHESLNDFFEDNGMLKVVDRHLVLPSRNVDSRYNRCHS